VAITIDYSDDVTPQYIINVPRLDMLDVTGGGPTEIRQLNIDSFRRDLDDLMDDDIGIVFETTHVHTPPLTVAGVTLARVVEILDPYVVQFENLTYNVNIVGGNSNISDKTVKNQVGVNTANSAGLQDPFALQFSAFANEVAIKANSGLTGTTFPLGTRSFPVNNLADALFIANERGLNTFRIIGNFTIATTDFSNGFTFKGDNPQTTTITINASSNVTNCEFSDATVQGTLDGSNIIRNCDLLDVAMFNGTIYECGLGGTVTLGTGSVAEIIDCFSNVAGGGPGLTPTIDCGGAAGTDLLMRDYHGGLTLANCSAAIVASIDISSGRIIFNSNITAGDFTVRGICAVTDNSTGAAVINDLTLTTEVLKTRQHATNKLVTDPVTGIAQLFDDAGNPLEASQMYEDAAGSQTYRGQGAERREKFA
jgi:hypothetical protein